MERRGLADVACCSIQSSRIAARRANTSAPRDISIRHVLLRSSRRFMCAVSRMTIVSSGLAGLGESFSSLTPRRPSRLLHHHRPLEAPRLDHTFLRPARSCSMVHCVRYPGRPGDRAGLVARDHPVIPCFIVVSLARSLAISPQASRRCRRQGGAELQAGVHTGAAQVRKRYPGPYDDAVG